MWTALRSEPDLIIRYSHTFLVCGMAMIAIAMLTDAYGIITGYFALILGAAGSSLERWREERGLWMLALVFFLMNAFIYVGFCYGQLRDAIRGVKSESFWLGFDVTIGTILLVITMRFLANIAKENYCLAATHHKRLNDD